MSVSEIEPGDVLIDKKTGIVGVFIEWRRGFAKVKLGKIHPTYAAWTLDNCELYAKKVNKDV